MKLHMDAHNAFPTVTNGEYIKNGHKRDKVSK